VLERCRQGGVQHHHAAVNDAQRLAHCVSISIAIM
jgi:hypothetical protein